MLICIAFSFYSYVKIAPNSATLFDTTVYVGNSMATNYIAYGSLVSGIFTIAMILVNYAVQWLICKDRRDKLGNPFAALSMDSVSQFLYTVLFAGLVVLLMYFVVAVAALVFKADFRICTLAVQVGNIEWLPAVLKLYLPMWLIFYVPYAAMNANTRFSDMPEWLSTLLCAISNSVALLIMLIIQYSTIVSKGVVMPYNAMGGLMAFTLIPILAFAAVSTRYIYKKTGNGWLAGIINGTIFCLMMIYGNGWGSDIMFF